MILHVVIFWGLSMVSWSTPVTKVHDPLFVDLVEAPQTSVPAYPSAGGSAPQPGPGPAAAAPQEPVSAPPKATKPPRKNARPKDAARTRSEKPPAQPPGTAPGPAQVQQIVSHPQEPDSIASLGGGPAPGPGESDSAASDAEDPPLSASGSILGGIGSASAAFSGSGIAAHRVPGGGGGGVSGLAPQEAVPLYKSNPPPDYPAAARRRGYEGTVILEVLVNADGKVADLRLSHSSGYPMLDQTALSSVKAWIFVPAKKGQEPVETWVKIPVCFQLKD